MASFGNISLGSNPFVGVSDEIVLWGGKRCAIKRVVVGGKIYDCGQGPNTNIDILSAISSWQDAALAGYQGISAGGFSANYARCDSLEIINSDYLGAEYRAEFLAYPDDWFSKIIGILDPVDNINVSVGKDGLMVIKRTVSARAADDRGLDKVRGWISSLNITQAPDISKFGFGGSVAKPKSVVETKDRINGSISAEVTFIQNEGASVDTILTYSVDAQYDDRAGIYSVTVSGTIEGHTESNISTVRDQVKSIGAFEIASSAFTNIKSDVALDPSPASLSFSENDETDTVSFNITYNTFPIGGVKKYFNFTVDYDDIKDITTVTISGTVNFDSKVSMKERKNLIQGIIESYDFPGLCDSEFYAHSPSQNVPLNLKNPVSYSVTVNNGSEISADVSVSYSNEDILPPGAENDFISFNYDIEVNPSSNVLVPVQFTSGGGGAFNFKAENRGSASIKGSAIGLSADMGTQVLDIANGLLDDAISSFGFEDEILLEKNVISSNTSDNGYAYEFEIKKGAIIKLA